MAYENKPLISFGVIADIQYADRHDGTNFDKSRVRHYRNALKHVENAVEDWKNAGVDFVLSLGDTIDGHCRRQKERRISLDKVLNVMSKVERPTYYLWGNHELYNFKRTELCAMTKFNPRNMKNVIDAGGDKAYFHFKVAPNLRIVALDSYAVSTLGLDRESTEYKEAYDILRSVNTKNGLNCSEGLPEEHKRFVEYNGGIGQEQLIWLDNVLTEADKLQENVIILSHVPVFNQASSHKFLCWDAEDALTVLHKHDCVRALFAGHFHAGGYALDEKGIHHITFEGVVEAKPGSSVHAIVDVHEKGLCLKGSKTLQILFKT